MRKKIFGIAFCSILLLLMAVGAGSQAADNAKPEKISVERANGRTISDDTTYMMDEGEPKSTDDNFPVEQPVITDADSPSEDDLTTKMLDE